MPRRPPSLFPEDEPLPNAPGPAPVRHRLGHTREFTAVNALSGQPLSDHDIAPADPAAASLPCSRPTPPPAPSVSDDPNDVFAIRRLNLAREKACADELLPPVDNSARRRHWRDYWLILLLGNTVLGLAAWFLPGIIVLVYAGSGMIMLTLSITWLYVFVLDPR